MLQLLLLKVDLMPLLLRKLKRIDLNSILKVSIKIIVYVRVDVNGLSFLRKIRSWRMDRFRIC